VGGEGELGRDCSSRFFDLLEKLFSLLSGLKPRGVGGLSGGSENLEEQRAYQLFIKYLLIQIGFIRIEGALR
jgi:hypothetical protein